MRMTLLSRAAAALSFVLVSATAALSQAPLPAADNQRIHGGWVMTVIPDPSLPVLPPVQPGVFVMLFTSEGGVMSQQNSALPPGLVSTGGTGAWKRMGPNAFAVTQHFTVAALDATGGHPSNLIVQRLLLHYGASNDEMSGTADWALLGLNGNVLFSAPFTVTLKRVIPQLVGSPF